MKRDTLILIIAVICGFSAFYLVFGILKNSEKPVTPPTIQVEERPTIEVVEKIEIPAGMRALAVSGSDFENIPGLVEQGAYVDILGMAPDYAGKLELQTIVQSAQVIKIDRPADNQVKAITLALSPAGATIVSKAVSKGKLHLLVRPDGGEKEVFKSDEVGATEVIRGVKKTKNINI